MERMRLEVWNALEIVIRSHPILLNHAPTPHRLGIQAFEPVLVEGRALKFRPLVCIAYNVDSGGNQMTVHVPFSVEMQTRARFLMLTIGSLPKPSDGHPVTVPTRDMVLGSYYLTLDRDGEQGEGKIFRDVDETLMVHDTGVVRLHVKIKVRHSLMTDGHIVTDLVGTIVGHIIFNRLISQNLGCVDRSIPENHPKSGIDFLVGKKQLGEIIDHYVRVHGTSRTAEMLDSTKLQGYKYSTKSTITVAVNDTAIPEVKKTPIKGADHQIDMVTDEYRNGLFSESKCYNTTLEIRGKTIGEVTNALRHVLNRCNPIFMMADPGVRGSMSQIRQLADIRDLIISTSDRTIEIPIKASYREGLNVPEYLISSRGTRKGLADTALRTTGFGYLTRRLVGVSQETIVREDDCGTSEGLEVFDIREDKESIEPLIECLQGRYLVEDFTDEETGAVLVPEDKLMDEQDAELTVPKGTTYIKARSILNCCTRHGICKKCYGANLANGQSVDVGEAVGIIVARPISEPSMRLAMRTFHTDGATSAGNTTQGLPRVEELFEGRKPKHLAIISEISDEASFEEARKSRHIMIANRETSDQKSYLVPFGSYISVEEGQEIKAGTRLTKGSVDPHDVLAIDGPQAMQDYLIQEVQHVHRMQGVDIDDKHIKVIVRQMMKKVHIEEAGDTNLLPGALIDKSDLEAENEVAQGCIDVGEADLQFTTFTPMLLGITKVPLTTDSFLLAASFQEATRVLTDVAIKGKTDPLLGLRENVCISKLIPTGTGMKCYGDVKVETEKPVLTDDAISR